jgi:hypothetical protein
MTILPCTNVRSDETVWDNPNNLHVDAVIRSAPIVNEQDDLSGDLSCSIIWTDVFVAEPAMQFFPEFVL